MRALNKRPKMYVEELLDFIDPISQPMEQTTNDDEQHKDQTSFAPFATTLTGHQQKKLQLISYTSEPIKCVLGVPGSGKSSLCLREIHRHLVKGKKVNLIVPFSQQAHLMKNYLSNVVKNRSTIALVKCVSSQVETVRRIFTDDLVRSIILISQYLLQVSTSNFLSEKQNPALNETIENFKEALDTFWQLLSENNPNFSLQKAWKLFTKESNSINFTCNAANSSAIIKAWMAGHRVYSYFQKWRDPSIILEIPAIKERNSEADWYGMCEEQIEEFLSLSDIIKELTDNQIIISIHWLNQCLIFSTTVMDMYSGTCDKEARLFIDDADLLPRSTLKQILDQAENATLFFSNSFGKDLKSLSHITDYIRVIQLERSMTVRKSLAKFYDKHLLLFGPIYSLLRDLNGKELSKKFSVVSSSFLKELPFQCSYSFCPLLLNKIICKIGIKDATIFILTLRQEQIDVLENVVKCQTAVSTSNITLKIGVPESFINNYCDFLLIPLEFCCGPVFSSLSSNACIDCSFYYHNAKQRLRLAFSRARQGIIYVGQIPDFFNRHSGISFPLERFYKKTPGRSIFLAELPPREIRRCSKLCYYSETAGITKIQEIIDNQLQLNGAHIIIRSTRPIKLASNKDVAALSLLNCLMAVVGNRLSLDVFRRARYRFNEYRHLGFVYPNVCLYPRCGEQSARHCLESLVGALSEFQLGQSWETCHVICRGVRLEQLVKAVEVPDAHTPAQSNFNIKVLRKEDFVNFELLLNSLRVGTSDFVIGNSTDVALEAWRSKHFDYSKSRRKKKEVIVLLIESNNDGLQLLEKLSACCSAYMLTIGRGIILDLFSNTAESWIIPSSDDYSSPHVNSFVVRISPEDDLRFLRASLAYFKQCDGIIITERNLRSSLRVKQVLNLVGFRKVGLPKLFGVSLPEENVSEANAWICCLAMSPRDNCTSNSFTHSSRDESYDRSNRRHSGHDSPFSNRSDDSYYDHPNLYSFESHSGKASGRRQYYRSDRNESFRDGYSCRSPCPSPSSQTNCLSPRSVSRAYGADRTTGYSQGLNSEAEYPASFCKNDGFYQYGDRPLVPSIDGHPIVEGRTSSPNYDSSVDRSNAASSVQGAFSGLCFRSSQQKRNRIQQPLCSSDRQQWQIPRQENSEIQMSDAQISLAQISKPETSRTEIFKPPISKAQISKAQISKAQISKAQISKAQISKAQISKAQISKAQISKAQISKAQISKAQISKAQISKAQISKAQISKPNILKPQIAIPKQDNPSLHPATAALKAASTGLKNVPKWMVEGQKFEGDDPKEALKQGQEKWKKKMEESKDDILVDLSVTRREAALKALKGSKMDRPRKRYH